MIVFVVAVDAHLQLPPRPSHQCTISMVREGVETQSTQLGQGARNTLTDEDDDIPLVGFKKQNKTKKNCLYKFMTCILITIIINMNECLYDLPTYA